MLAGLRTLFTQNNSLTIDLSEMKTWVAVKENTQEATFHRLHYKILVYHEPV